ncbi:MAG: cupin domain-containing protein [Acidimicrobiia bacterium]
MGTPQKVIRLEKSGPPDSGLHAMTCDPADFASELPTQTLHEYYSDDELGMSVGVWTTSSMQEAFGPYPGDEFVLLLEGGFKMVDGNNETLDTYRQGESVYFRNGAPVSWVQEGHLRKFYITYLNPNREVPDNVEAAGAVKAVDPSVTAEQMTVLDDTDPFIVKGPQPVQRDHIYFTNDTEDMFVGLWDSMPFESEMAPFPTHEFVQLLEGKITITEEDGTVSTFVPGDVFFVPQGTVCSWQASTYVKKYYAVLVPPDLGV